MPADPFTAYNAATSIVSAATSGKDLMFGTAKGKKNVRVSKPPVTSHWRS